jgi:large subunit ribosomal protein L28
MFDSLGYTMAKKCDITGKGPVSANNVSHANNRTKRRQYINLQRKRFWVPELDRYVRLRVSTSTMRSIDKMGLNAFLKKNEKTLADVS